MSQQPMKRYWVYHLNILDDKPSNEPCIKHEVFKAVYLAADVEGVEAERDAYKAQCECRYCKGHHCNISVCSKCGMAGNDAPHFIQQAHALAAKEAVIAQLTGDVGAKEWALANTLAERDTLQAELVRCREATIDECRKKICMYCNDPAWTLNEDGVHETTQHRSQYPCKAAALLPSRGEQG